MLMIFLFPFSRGSIHQLEEKFGNFYLAVMTLRVHLMNEMRYGSAEGSLFSALHKCNIWATNHRRGSGSTYVVQSKLMTRHWLINCFSFIVPIGITVMWDNLIISIFGSCHHLEPGFLFGLGKFDNLWTM
jgi:hypothetical protein